MSKKHSRNTRRNNAVRVKPIKVTHTVDLDIPVPVLVAQETAPVADVEVTMVAHKEPFLRRAKAAFMVLLGK